MNKKITLGTSIALIIFAALIAFTATYMVLNKAYQDRMDKYLKYTDMYEKLYNFDNIVKSEYIGDIDDSSVMDGILSGYMDGLGDKYGMYYSAEEYADYVMQMSGKKVGIGVTVHYDEATQSIEVIGVSAGSPAAGAGIAEGDRIVSVGELTVEKDGYSTVVDAISGNEGESVSLSVLKKDTGVVSELKLVRAVVSYSSVSSRVYDGYIGIVQISEFNHNTADEFKKAVNELKKSGIVAFIFDVRNNLGGDLDAICEVLDYILPEGKIVTLVDSDGNEKTISSDKNCLEGQICVLTNKYTASAAELFSAAIRDYKYGTLVGTVTYGKGTAQTVKKFPDNSGLRLSTEMYMPPCGVNYEGVGVTPDVEVEYAAGENGAEDSQMTAAIEIIDNNTEEQP